MDTVYNNKKKKEDEYGNPVQSAAYQSYTPSATVTAAQDAVKLALSQKPGAYQATWSNQLNDTLGKILNGEKFTYDLNGDALYQQYKDQYINGGKLAMQDTMGQAAALTGGYGNSYAVTAGNQAYQEYLKGLTDKIPELYQLAYNKYRDDKQDLLNQYSVLSQQDQLDYGRHRDNVSDYYNDLNMALNIYNTEADRDFNRFTNERNFNYGAAQDAIANALNQAKFDEGVRQYNDTSAYRDRTFDYQQKQDAIANDRAERQLAESITNSQYNRWSDTRDFEFQKERAAATDAYNAAKLKLESKSGSGSGSKSSGTKYREAVNRIEELIYDGADKDRIGRELLGYLYDGDITADQYAALIETYVTGESEGNGKSEGDGEASTLSPDWLGDATVPNPGATGEVSISKEAPKTESRVILSKKQEEQAKKEIEEILQNPDPVEREKEIQDYLREASAYPETQKKLENIVKTKLNMWNKSVNVRMKK